VNRAIGRVATAVIVMLLLLVGQLTYLQVIDAKELADDPRNSRTYLRDFTRPRGEIISADGKILARSVPSDDEYELQRVYPFGELFSQIVGYQSVVVGSTGVEKEYNDILSGRDTSGLQLKDLGELLLGKETTGNVVLSLRTDAQLVAKQALGDQQGSVVVMNPTTGALIAMYSNPSFDPQPLAGHNPEAVQAYWDVLRNDPANRLLPRAYRERYPPGSTFKIATTEAALDTGKATPTTVFPTVRSITPPQAGRPISNFGGSSCGGTLEESFIRSCNTTFAELGLQLGEEFPPRLAGFGIYEQPPLDLQPGAAVSSGPTPGTFDDNKPLFALAGIGQGEVATTPLQMAMISGAVANGGTVMRPHVAAEIRDDEGRVVSSVDARAWKEAMPPTTAATIRDFMVQVVNSPRGTGTSARIAGLTVAGKTGTAQTCDTCTPHAWFVAFAPAEAPQYAVSVIVERGGSMGDEATGGRVAAPIAATVLRHLLGR
jgi:peptidoglycan glycosyltransferase